MDQEGDQVRPGGRQEEPAVARPDLGHGLVLLPQARLLRRVDHPPPAVPRRRGRGLQDLRRPRDRTAGSVGNDNFKLGYGWFCRAVELVDDGARPHVRAARPSDIQYVDPTPQRKGRPDDIAFRSMPAHAQTRYAAGLEKMSIVRHPGHLRRGRQERMGQRAATSGSSSASTSSCRTTRSRRDGKLVTRHDPARRRVPTPSELKAAAPRTSSTGPTAGPTR